MEEKHRATDIFSGEVVEVDDLTMLKTPRLWPAWPKLPLKRYVNGVQQLGFLIHSEYKGTTTIVFVGNIFDHKFPWNMDQINYASYDAILADGWRID